MTYSILFICEQKSKKMSFQEQGSNLFAAAPTEMKCHLGTLILGEICSDLHHFSQRLCSEAQCTA